LNVMYGYFDYSAWLPLFGDPSLLTVVVFRSVIAQSTCVDNLHVPAPAAPGLDKKTMFVQGKSR